MKEKYLSSSIQYIKGVGPKRISIFNKIGIKKVEDLLYYFPFRYEDRSNFCSISELKEGQYQTIKATIMAKGKRLSWRRKNFSIFELAVGDSTGKLFCIWFNQPYLVDYFKIGATVILYGKVERYQNRLQMVSPEFELVEENDFNSINMGRLVPVYRIPQEITQRYLRQLIKYILDKYLIYIKDFLPYDIRVRNDLFNIAKALINIHFPKDQESQKRAWKRLCFEEFFIFQLALMVRKLKKKQQRGIIHKVEGNLVDNFIKNLAFELTEDQKKVIQEIKEDLLKPYPMYRLLQGDVGSGKTVVATIASLMAIQGGYQVAFLVPTEILATQHYNVIKEQFSSLEYSPKVGILTSSLKKKDKLKISKEIKEGTIKLIIGTHALLEEDIEFKNLGLVIIDEQHKFGVSQRAILPKKGNNPDILILTATPIPRTLAITLYGDLDISIIRQLPWKNRSVSTLWITEEKRNWLYEFIKEKILQGEQVYIVYPIIEENFNLELLSVEKMYKEFKQNTFREFKVGMLHGRMRKSYQEKIMQEFREKKIQILIATTVLEVGIDVSNATVMVIEHAERFGLSQLHQLRGRIGRGCKESFCILISDPANFEAKERLEAMVKYNDGFQIAEIDLKIRGPGEFFGKRQHGLSELRIINQPLTQLELLKQARKEAISLIQKDPFLKLPEHQLLKSKLLERFPGYERLIFTG
ncbi:MAG: ATP-dependent DNA helicase RecG [Candidatus Omnitrophica bacterium]|nr:ATP-dependent DNA helicase RecG [Candidatus Omnitrophota bacterium]MCM8799334.1 ATP-dependent DNA helicase RecG [Candidatus Omnitrophota bacterium]